MTPPEHPEYTALADAMMPPPAKAVTDNTVEDIGKRVFTGPLYTDCMKEKAA